MIRKDGRCECDYCHGVEGSFFSDTGNHVSCQQIGEQTTVASLVDAELTALRGRVAELESERRFIDGIVMGDGDHDKIMLTKDAMIFMRCMKLLGLDVSGCGPESIVDAITALKSQ